MTAGDSFLDAATALDTYASTLTWAQGQAQEAINAWNTAQTATKNAQTQYHTYQQQGGTQPFQDPGESGRAAAKKILNNADQPGERGQHRGHDGRHGPRSGAREAGLLEQSRPRRR